MFNPDLGIINRMLSTVFSISPRWFTQPWLARAALLIVNTWLGYPYWMLVTSGALQSIPSDIYEAADLDGANRLQVFRYIIAPGIRPIILLQMILAVKGAISVYEIPFIVTGGRFGSSTFVIQTTETAFKFQKVGLASAMAVVLFLIIVVVTVIQKLVLKEDK